MNELIHKGSRKEMVIEVRTRFMKHVTEGRTKLKVGSEKTLVKLQQN